MQTLVTTRTSQHFVDGDLFLFTFDGWDNAVICDAKNVAKTLRLKIASKPLISVRRYCKTSCTFKRVSRYEVFFALPDASKNALSKHYIFRDCMKRYTKEQKLWKKI